MLYNRKPDDYLGIAQAYPKDHTKRALFVTESTLFTIVPDDSFVQVLGKCGVTTLVISNNTKVLILLLVCKCEGVNFI